jgi:hypothetical protein
VFNPLNAELNPVCHLLALLGAHLVLHVSRVRVKNISKKHYILREVEDENNSNELSSTVEQKTKRMR